MRSFQGGDITFFGFLPEPDLFLSGFGIALFLKCVSEPFLGGGPFLRIFLTR